MMIYTLKEHEQKALFPKNEKFTEAIGTIQKIESDKIAQLSESTKGKKDKKLIVKMEAIHVGRTRNFTYYTEEGLKNGLNSWTQPYQKPVLTHHNEYSGEAIGRILEAKYEEATLSGKPGLVFTVEITDPTAQEKVLDGRYQTVSIGASTDKVTCNICGTDRTEDWCEHYPGRTYGEGDDKQTAHFIVGTTYGREVSYVNTPADENAGNRSISVEESTNNTHAVHTEMYQMAEGMLLNLNNPSLNLYEGLQEDAKKLVDQLSKLNEGSGQNVPNAAEGVTTESQTAEGQTTEGAQSEPTTNVQEGASNTVEGATTEGGSVG